MRLKLSGERRSETGESLALDAVGDKQAVSPRKEAVAGRGRAGDRGPVVELAIGGQWSSWRSSPWSKAEGLASEARLGSRRPEGERSTPDQAGTRFRRGPKGGHSAIGRAHGSGEGRKPPVGSLIDPGA
jgi:hypothetical protein